MTIKTDWPWPLKVAFLGIVLGLSAAAAMWAYDLGRGFTAFGLAPSKSQIDDLQRKIDALTTERDGYSSKVNAAESQLNIERSAQKQLSAQIKTLAAENAKLKEDLAFFERLLPADTGSGISIRRLQAELIAPNQLRYRLLLMQGAKDGRNFVGDLQFAVAVVQADKSAMMMFPQGNAGEANKLKVNFKHYQRIEGVLTLPEGVAAKSIQARVLEKGQIRAQQSANL
jgi:septal ring factor EnvC (AmiA/AmiB activator)